jgi:hypothetical protein
MSTSNPLSDQCTAKSKASGQRCRRWVVGGGVCPMHGGAAPQVRARREARRIQAEAALTGAAVPRDPATALLAAAQDADSILQRIKLTIGRDQELTPALLTALGDWIDRTSRVAKLVVDARIDERRTRLSEQQGRILALTIQAILGRLELSPAQRDLIPVVVPEELRRAGQMELEAAGGST